MLHFAVETEENCSAISFINPFMGNDRLSGKQVVSQASRRVTRRLAWIQPICICINAVPALKGLRECLSFNYGFEPHTCIVLLAKVLETQIMHPMGF